MGSQHGFEGVNPGLGQQIQKITIYKNLNGLALILTHPYTGPKGRTVGIGDSDDRAGYSPYVQQRLDHTYGKYTETEANHS